MSSLFLKWLSRVLFVAVLVGFGLWLEHGYYSSFSKNNAPVSAKDPSKVRILFIGGSQLVEIPFYFEKYLNLGTEPKKFEVFSMNLPGFAVTGLNQYHAFLTEKYHPDYILALIACGSTLGDLNGQDIPKQDSIYKNIGTLTLPTQELQKMPSSDYFFLVETTFTELLQKHDRQNLSTFNFLSPERLFTNEQLAAFNDFLVQQTLEFIGNKISTQRDWRIFELLIDFGENVKKEMIEKNLAVPAAEMAFYTRYPDKPHVVVDIEQEIFAPGAKFIDEGLAFLDQHSCQEFMARTDFSLQYNRLWLCGVHQRLEGKSAAEKEASLIELFSSLNRFYFGFVRAQYWNGRLPKELKQKYFTKTVERMREQFQANYRLDPEDSETDPVVEEQFLENMKVFEAKYKPMGQKLILFHPPNSHDKILAEAAKMLNAPIVESQGLLDQEIKKEGREQYFLDNICGSGHLTAKGADIFGEYLANRFKDILIEQQDSARTHHE